MPPVSLYVTLCPPLLLAVAVWTPGPAHAAPAFTPCQIGAQDSPLHLQAKCTTLTVPEDRANPNGRKIGLHIAVLSARVSRPAADPLFFIAGGPGQAATEAFVEEAPAFDRIRSDRDIVLLDQRGTGESNPLNCPASPDTGTNLAATQIAQQVQVCLKQLSGDPRFYTTSVAVQDLDAVRAALGYGSIDIYGISYGTRVALEYLREFPQHVRSMILDGVLPADLVLGPGVSLDAQRALDRIFARCAQDRACNQAFPDLPGTLAALEQRFAHQRVTVQLRDPLSGAPRSGQLSWPDITGAVRLMSYASETAALLPLLLHQAGVEHDYAPLMAESIIFTDEVTGGIAYGMNAAVLCTEDVPFYTQAPATDKAMQDTYVGVTPAAMLAKTCRFWPRGVLAPDFKQAVVSDKPVLLISGEDDPITPPANAAHAASTLRNSLSIVVPGQGHGNAYRGCIPRLMARFVERASVKHLDTACVKSIRPFPFFTSFTGPGP